MRILAREIYVPEFTAFHFLRGNKYDLSALVAWFSIRAATEIGFNTNPDQHCYGSEQRLPRIGLSKTALKVMRDGTTFDAIEELVDRKNC